MGSNPSNRKSVGRAQPPTLPTKKIRWSLQALPSRRGQSPGIAKGDNLLVSLMVLFFSLRRTPYSSEGCE
jgi:hypothetical protein